MDIWGPMYESAHLGNFGDESSDMVRRLGDELEDLRVTQDRHAADLGEVLSDVHNSIGRLEGKLAEFSVALSQIHHAVRGVRATADATHSALTSFVERYGRDQIVARAQAELSQLTTEWTVRFAQRRQVRALARGLAHALTEDAVQRGLVDTGTIEACSQQQLLVEPSFWLAPAVVAVAAGYSRDDERAARARGYALTLDQAKATLFFALTCSRQKRQSEAARWMDRYLAGLDPAELGEEFTVVLEAVAGAELGFEALTYARQAMTRWVRERTTRPFTLFHADSASGHLIRWQRWIMKWGADGSKQFDDLRKLSGPQWAAAERGWRAATAVEGTLDYLRHEYSASPPTAERGHRTDIALSHLISQLDPDERQMREQMERLRAIIQHKGDTATASEEPLETEETDAVDFETLLEQAVFSPESAGLGYPARLLALHSAWPSLRPAVIALAQHSQALLPGHFTLTLNDWSTQLPAEPTAPGTRQRLVAELRGHLERRTDTAVVSVAPLWKRIAACFTASMASVVLALFLGGAVGHLVEILAVLLLSYAGWGVVRVPFRRHQLREDGARRRTESTAELKGALSQHALLLEQWRAGLAAASQWSSWSPPAGEKSKPQPEN